MTSTHPAALAALLDKAADQINRYGLYRGDWFDMNGWHHGTINPRATAVCAGAAIALAGGWRPALNDSTEVPESVEATLAGVWFADWLITQGQAARRCPHQPALSCRDLSCFDAVETVADWSDHPSRTAQQAVEALRTFAASLRTPACDTTTGATR